MRENRASGHLAVLIIGQNAPAFPERNRNDVPVALQALSPQFPIGFAVFKALNDFPGADEHPGRYFPNHNFPARKKCEQLNAGHSLAPVTSPTGAKHAGVDR
jgi:hypothetical protein